MKEKLISIITIILSLAITPGIVLAYPQVLGKDDAPGQQKKTEDVNVGQIENVQPGRVEVKSQGKKFDVFTNESTVILEKPNGKPLSVGQLKKNDQIAIFATPSANATKSARLLLIRSATGSATTSAGLAAKRRAVYGLIREINGTVLTISHPIKDNPKYQVEVIDLTQIKIKGIAAPTLGDLKVGDRVSAVGIWDGDILVAKIVHVIPGKATGLFNKVGTPSATVTATPSATPTATASATPTP